MKSKLKRHEVKDFLEESYLKFNQKSFIENDPVCIPHRFSKKEDIEIAAFFAATIAWGNRKSIIQNANKLMQLMDESPHDFVLNHSKKDLKPFEKFVHRTFNGTDCIFFIESLKHIYAKKGGLEAVFTSRNEQTRKHAQVDGSGENIKSNIIQFRNTFLETKHLARSEKHISNPDKNSSAKRLCMYLRWMVRKDKKGVDFGIWKNISPAELCLPLDVHTGNVSRALGLLQRNQDDWKAVEEITSVLCGLDKNDPVKYDFALFGLGVDGFLKK